MTAPAPPPPGPAHDDVPATGDAAARRPRRRPPSQSDIHGINTIASLPDHVPGPPDDAGGPPGRTPGRTPLPEPDPRAGEPDAARNG
jgi:hypothetical protein